MTTTTIACMSRRRRLERLWLNTHTKKKNMVKFSFQWRQKMKSPSLPFPVANSIKSRVCPLKIDPPTQVFFSDILFSSTSFEPMWSQRGKNPISSYFPGGVRTSVLWLCMHATTHNTRLLPLPPASRPAQPSRKWPCLSPQRMEVSGPERQRRAAAPAP